MSGYRWPGIVVPATRAPMVPGGASRSSRTEGRQVFQQVVFAPSTRLRATVWMSSKDECYLTRELLVVHRALSVGLAPPANIGGQRRALLPSDQTR